MQGRKFWDCFVTWASWEWILNKRPNGGTAVFVRSLLIALELYAFGLFARNMIDPARTGDFHWTELRTQLLDSFQWFGTIFAGAYVALYSRFASQWAYLASLYNQIKQAECERIENPAQTRLHAPRSASPARGPHLLQTHGRRAWE
jgi:hypothetical protein